MALQNEAWRELWRALWRFGISPLFMWWLYRTWLFLLLSARPRRRGDAGGALLEHEDLEGPAALAAEHPRAGVHAAATDEPLLAESQRWFKSKSRRLLNVSLFIYVSPQLLKFGEVQRG